MIKPAKSYYQKCKYTGRPILKSVTKLIGAKYKLRSLLYQLFPPHKTYCEPFLGSWGCLIGAPKAEKECGTDISPFNINFFQQLRDRPEDLYNKIQEYLKEVTPESWDRLRKSLKQNFYGDELNTAALYYIINKACVNGIVRFNNSGVCNSTYCGTLEGRGWLTKEWMELVRERIKDVQFWCTDYTYLFTFDKQDTFYYLDPPYYAVWTSYDKVKFTKEQHFALKKNLDSLSSTWLLSINDHPDIRELYRDYEIIEVQNQWTCSTKPASNSTTQELLIANYEICSTYEKLMELKKKDSIQNKGVRLETVLQ